MYNIFLGALIGLAGGGFMVYILLKYYRKEYEEGIKFWQNEYGKLSKDANKIADELEKMRDVVIKLKSKEK